MYQVLVAHSARTTAIGNVITSTPTISAESKDGFGFFPLSKRLSRHGHAWEDDVDVRMLTASPLLDADRLTER